MQRGYSRPRGGWSRNSFCGASPSVANGTWGLGNERMGEAHVIVCGATLPAERGAHP